MCVGHRRGFSQWSVTPFNFVDWRCEVVVGGGSHSVPFDINMGPSRTSRKRYKLRRLNFASACRAAPQSTPPSARTSITVPHPVSFHKLEHCGDCLTLDRVDP
jgi:hypothetical protein